MEHETERSITQLPRNESDNYSSFNITPNSIIEIEKTKRAKRRNHYTTGQLASLNHSKLRGSTIRSSVGHHREIFWLDQEDSSKKLQ